MLVRLYNPEITTIHFLMDLLHESIVIKNKKSNKLPLEDKIRKIIRETQLKASNIKMIDKNEAFNEKMIDETEEKITK